MSYSGLNFNLTLILFHLLSILITHGLQFPEIKSRILSGDPIDFPGQKAPSADINSHQPWRLKIEDESLLIGAPGQRINIRIRLSNLENTSREFNLIIKERGREGYHLIEGKSTSNLFVRGGESQVFTLNLRIPQTAKNGHRNIIRVSAVASGSTPLIRIQSLGERILTPKYVELDFSFLIGQSFSDDQSPRILSTSIPINSQCSPNDDCSQTNWKSIFFISDDESGIRSIETDPYIDLNSRSLNFAHNPYILGDPSHQVRYVLTGSCCLKQLYIRARDGFGNEAKRSLFSETSSNDGGLNGLEIGIIVVSVFIVVVLIAAVIVIITIRRKRAANLEEIRRYTG